MIVADGGEDGATAEVAADSRWLASGLNVRRICVRPPNAVRQRVAAIRSSRGEFLFLLDDDVVLEPDCVEEMLIVLRTAPEAVAVTADFSNCQWPQPTRVWRFYLRRVLGLAEGEWQGRVLGPLLRFGFNPVPADCRRIHWLGAGNSMVRRSAYEQVGGFSNFFLHRSSMNEDVDLGLKLSRVGPILFCPRARMAHHQSPNGRVSVSMAAEDDLFNRFLILRCTVGKSAGPAFALVGVFFLIETASGFLGCFQRFALKGFLARLVGRPWRACEDYCPSISLPPMSRKVENWVILGDSLAEGVGSQRVSFVSELVRQLRDHAKDGDAHWAIHEMRLRKVDPAEFNRFLRVNIAGHWTAPVRQDSRTIWVWNLGCEGRTIDGDLEWLAWLENLRPELVVVFRGSLESILRPECVAAWELGLGGYRAHGGDLPQWIRGATSARLGGARSSKRW